MHSLWGHCPLVSPHHWLAEEMVGENKVRAQVLSNALCSRWICFKGESKQAELWGRRRKWSTRNHKRVVCQDLIHLALALNKDIGMKREIS